MNSSRNHSNFIFILILLISIAIAIYHGTLKQGYHMDELYSYGLANSSYLPFLHMGDQEYSVYDWMKEYGAGDNIVDLLKNGINDFKILANADFHIKDTELYTNYLKAQACSSDTYTTTWLTGDYYKEYLTAGEGSTFNLASVYYNQRGDVHPPLFYLALNFVSSFFPGVFSKWFGISINICFLGLALVVLYNMCRKYLFNDMIALAICACYGMSASFSSTAIFIRMYALLTLMILLFLDFNLYFYTEKYILKKHDLLKFGVITILGYTTHYYFVIFAGMTALVMAIIIAISKQWKFLFKYIGTLLISAVVGLIIWPFSIKHVFLGYRGTESLGILKSGSFYWIKVKVIFTYIFDNILCGNWWLVPLAIGTLLIASIVANNFKLDFKKIILVFLPIFVYICLVSQIVPYLTDRYFMCTYPFVIILIIGCVGLGCQKLAIRFNKIENLPKWVFMVFAALVVFLTYGVTHSAMYEYADGQETLYIPENTDCIYVLPDGDWNETAEEISILAQCENTAVVYESNLDTIKGYVPEDDTTLMICVRSSLDNETVLNNVIEALQLDEYEVDYEGANTGTFSRYFLVKNK